MIVLIRPRGRPRVVRRVDRDPGFSLARKLPRHRGAEGVDAVDQQRIDVRLDRIEIGREKQPRAVRPHLMDVVHDLRMPDDVQRVDGQTRLDLRERVPVAVVIVPRVFVVKLRRVSPFVRRAQCFVVPILDDVHAVRIGRRHQQDDRIAQDFLDFGFV